MKDRHFDDEIITAADRDYARRMLEREVMGAPRFQVISQLEDERRRMTSERVYAARAGRTVTRDVR